MGLRELLILVLILSIIAVILRGLVVALRSRKNRIKIALEKNIPVYDLDELELRELPNGGARMVQRSFEEVMRQASELESLDAAKKRPRSKVLKTDLTREAVLARRAAALAAAEAAIARGEVAAAPDLFSASDAHTPLPKSADDAQTDDSPEYDADAQAASDTPQYAAAMVADSEVIESTVAAVEAAETIAEESDMAPPPWAASAIRADEYQSTRVQPAATVSDYSDDDWMDDVSPVREVAVSRPAERAEPTFSMMHFDDELGLVSHEEHNTRQAQIQDDDNDLRELDHFATNDLDPDEDDDDDLDDDDDFDESDDADDSDDIYVSESVDEPDDFDDPDDPDEEDSADYFLDSAVDVDDNNKTFAAGDASDTMDVFTLESFSSSDDEELDMDEQPEHDDELEQEEELELEDDVQAEHQEERRPREPEEIDDVLDELLHERGVSTVVDYERAREPEPEPEFAFEVVHVAEPEPQPDLPPADLPEEAPDALPEEVPEQLPEEIPEQLPEEMPEPLPESEPEADTEQDDEEALPDFDSELEIEPEPQPQPVDSFAAVENKDDIDDLFKDEDQQRRLEALEQEQESTPKRFMSWAGATFGKLTSGIAESRARAAEEKAEREALAREQADLKQQQKELQREQEKARAAQQADQLRQDQQVHSASSDYDDPLADYSVDEMPIDADDYPPMTSERDDDYDDARRERANENSYQPSDDFEYDAEPEPAPTPKPIDENVARYGESPYKQHQFGHAPAGEAAATSASATAAASAGKSSPKPASRNLRENQLSLEMPTDDDINDGGFSQVLVINVMARLNTSIHGDELLPALLAAGLRFGDMSIFHRHADRKGGPVLFSVANALNPGTFDLNEISDFSTQGVTFFMTLPNVANNMLAFEQMLATARHVQSALDADLKDDNRSVMTAQTVEHYRQRIRDFELQQLKNSRQK